MNYDENGMDNIGDMHINIDDPRFKFSRERQGYSPEEVDTVIESLTAQNSALAQENERLSQALDTCGGKIQQLTRGVQELEQERRRESLRIAEVMTTAGRTADETLTNARHKAEEIIADARITAKMMKEKAESDVQSARQELSYLIDIIGTARESSNRHYAKLDELLQATLQVVDSAGDRGDMPVQPVQVQGQAVQASAPVQSAPIQSVQSAAGAEVPEPGTLDRLFDADPYDDFIRSISRSAGDEAADSSHGKIIGRFGN